MRIKIIRLLALLLLSSLLVNGLAQNQQPSQGGTLTVGRAMDVSNFDPTNLATANNIMMLQLFNTLVSLDENLNAQPELATSWEFSEDARSLTLTLRDDVTFHSGRPFTASDVAFSVRRYQDEQVGATMRASALLISDVTVEGDHTVTLHFDDPQPTILDFLDMLFIMDEETADSIATNPIGTGPYKLAAHVPGNEIRFERNEEYWKEGRPYLDAIVVRVIGDAAALLANLETGTVDWIERPSYSDLNYLDALPDIVVTVPESAPLTTSIQFNTSRSPLDDQRVRKAIDLAIDRERYTSLYFAGFADPMWVAPSMHALVEEEDWYQELGRDVDRARELLNEAGHGDGIELDMIVTTSIVHTGGVILAELVQQDLAEIGIQVNIDVAEGASYGDRSRAGDFDLRGAGYGRANRDPVTLLTGTSAFRPESNLSFYVNDEYTQMVQAAIGTIDEQQRRDAYRELARFIVDEAFILTLSPAYSYAAGFDWVRGVTTNVEGFFGFEEAWIDR